MQFPEIIKAFFALPSAMMIPYLFGNGLFVLIDRVFSFHEELDIVSKFLYSWFVGFFSLFVIGYICLLARAILREAFDRTYKSSLCSKGGIF